MSLPTDAGPSDLRERKAEYFMAKVMKAPGKYIQAAGELKNIGTHVKNMGTKFLVIISKRNQAEHGEEIKTSLEEAGYECVFETFGGECSLEEIDRLMKIGKEAECNSVIAVGGGKAIDTGKAVAVRLDVTVIVVPTIASNDAPCSALAVIHDENGAVTELRTTKRNPDVVLVDTNILIDAPERLFVAGMGDALATWFEANACRKSGAVTLAGEQSSDIALTLSKLCYDTLINRGHSALNAVRAGLVNDDFDSVVQASIYLSGVGFESGGVAAAHAINDGFSACAEAAHLYHGEIVAFGVLSMLMLEADDSETVDTVLNFMLDVGLPVSFKQLKIEPTDELLLRVANTACTESVMSNMPFKVTPADVVRAMLKADLVGSSRLK